MTYCLAITVNDGLIFASDSRTNAGVDQVSTFGKMHRFFGNGERSVTVLTAGNLATTQAVIRQIRRDIDAAATVNLGSVTHLSEAADYVGELSRKAQERHVAGKDDKFNPGASFILGGQIAGQAPQIFLVYPEGNHIRASKRAPFLQIGELKYGKPILDRIIQREVELETAARCALVSMDSTLRSNLTVGPPIELLTYRVDTLTQGEHIVFEEDDSYLRELRSAWQDNLRQAFETLPKLPSPSFAPQVRLVDGPGDQ